MKAIIRDAYGSVDALRLADIDQPVAGEVDVLVHVHAAGVDQGVWHLMTGTPYAMRLAGFGIRAPKNALLGYDRGRTQRGDGGAGDRISAETGGVWHVPGPLPSTPSLAQIASCRSPGT